MFISVAGGQLVALPKGQSSVQAHTLQWHLTGKTDLPPIPLTIYDQVGGRLLSSACKLPSLLLLQMLSSGPFAPNIFVQDSLVQSVADVSTIPKAVDCAVPDL